MHSPLFVVLQNLQRGDLQPKATEPYLFHFRCSDGNAFPFSCCVDDPILVRPFLVAPEKSEVHNDEPLTEAEVKALADAEQAFQKTQKERLEAERKEAKRQRAIARINKL